MMDHTSMADAHEALRKREGVSRKRPEEIGRWTKGHDSPELIIDLPEWATSRGIEGVVWTALPSKFNNNEEQKPTIDEVIKYLRELTGTARDNAESYIRSTPQQIDTPYRRHIEATLQWTYRRTHYVHDPLG
jgi:hypothetical protein